MEVRQIEHQNETIQWVRFIIVSHYCPVELFRYRENMIIINQLKG